MSFLKKNILYHFEFTTVFLFFCILLVMMSYNQTALAITAQGCVNAGGKCFNQATCPSGYDQSSNFGSCMDSGTLSGLCCKPLAGPTTCVTGIKTGTCKNSCTSVEDGSTNTACIGSTSLCCVAKTSTAGGLGASCTGENSGIAGTCKAVSNCAPADTDTTPSCAGGLICCATTPSGPSGSIPCTSITPSPTPVGCCGGTAGAPACTGTPLPGASASIPFTNPISVAGNSVEGVVGSISGVLQSIIVVLALVFIVIGAVIYVTSAGNDERMKTAKGAITASMIGLALAIAAPSFLKEIYSVLGGNLCANLTGAELTACQQSITSITASSTQSLTQLSLKVLQFLLSIIGILGIIMLVIGGLAYLTSAGDEERSGTGKKIITYAIIGIAVALASLIIVTQVANLFV